MPETLRASLEGFVGEIAGGAAGAAEKVAEAMPGSGALGTLLEQAGSTLPGGGPLEALGGQLKRPEQLARAAQVLLEARIIRADRPDKALRAARALLGFQFTPAAAIVVAALRYPDEPAIIDEKGTLTFREVDKRTNALAHAIQEAGVSPGDSVAIMCRDHRWFIEATVAISKLGATVLLYNTAFAGPQLKEVTEREDPKAIIYDEEFAEMIEDAVGDRHTWLAWHDGATGDGEPDENSV
jgi:fatty-acyl-CoA synthase